MTYQHCNGLHDLRVITKRYDGAPGIERVVRWCHNCGAVVIDIDLDGRTHQPGGGRPMIFPCIAQAHVSGVMVPDEREQFEAAMGEELKVSQGQYALSRAHMTGRPYTFLATIWAWEAWQRARGVTAGDGGKR